MVHYLHLLEGTVLIGDHRLIEFFSPYCHHCKALAPRLQTLYEFYYTSSPLQNNEENTDDLNSFSRYYNFKFAKVDCIAFGTACNNADVHSFPTLILFKDGKPQKKSVGALELPELSEWLEEILESIRPGSRPVGGPALPEVGASYVKMTKKPAAKGKAATKESKNKKVAAKEDKGKKLSTPAEGHGKPFKLSIDDELFDDIYKGKPKEIPNQSGKSMPLTAEKFQQLVTSTLEPWFVKFYAPWCHHCQAMAPNWREMAREMKDVMNVGEVNCDIEKRLCKDANVKGYPTVLFFRGGERVEYNGLRGVGDLITYAKKATDVGAGVSDIDLETFEKMEETEEVIFVYFYDQATTSEDFAALDRLTLSLIGRAKLVKTKDPKMSQRYKITTWPRLMVSRDGKPSYYQPIAPKDMRDYRRVLNWMKTVWQPIVAELTASNAREIMEGHHVVLGILSRERSDEFVIAKREIKNAALEWIDKETHARQLERQELRDAKQLRIEEAEDRNDQRALRAAKAIRIDVDSMRRPKVRFAWVDGVFWERWIRTTFGIDVKDGERVVINDEDVSSFRESTHAQHTDFGLHRTTATGTRPLRGTTSCRRARRSSRRSQRSSRARPRSRPSRPPPQSSASTIPSTTPFRGTHSSAP